MSERLIITLNLNSDFVITDGEIRGALLELEKVIAAEPIKDRDIHKSLFDQNNNMIGYWNVAKKEVIR